MAFVIYMRNLPTSRSAFTLVELSIVLVILGLLVGGVLAGQSLIHAAELRAATTEYTNYKTALGAFREKYSALPGDMTNAVKFWGAAPAASSDADGPDGACMVTTTPSTDATTCNGNGDGHIVDPEMFRAWQHLANAGLVEGVYTGVTSGPIATFMSAAGTNVPRSKLAQGGWTLIWLGSGGGSYFTINYRNALALGANAMMSISNGAFLKAEDAYTIDMKIDDGKPNTGIVSAFPSASRPNCTAGTDDAYLLSDTTTGCNLFFTTGY